MNKLEELKFNVEALFHAVNEDKKYFASIYNFAEKLNILLTIRISEAKKEEISFLSQKIESFFADYRPSGDSLYLPPMQTSRNDATVKDIFRLSKEIANLTEEEFIALKPRDEERKEKTTA